MSEEDAAFEYARSLNSSGTFPPVLHASIHLGLFDIIARAGPGEELSASEIAAQLPTKNPDAPFYLDRMLRLLACYSLLTCSSRSMGEEEDGKVERLYGLAPPAKAFVPDEDGGALSAFPPNLGMIEPLLYLKDFILEGGDNLFERVHGMTFYEYVSRDPEYNKGFNKTLTNYSKRLMKKILEIYKGFEGVTSLLDVGGGSGAIIDTIVSKYPSIKGTNFDQPHVIQNAPTYPGVEQVAGDMFVSIPKAADTLMMKDVLHNWSDELCVKVLQNCYDALPSQGKLIVISFMIAETAESSSGAKHVAHFDITMFMHHGGRERTEREFKALGKAAGFSGSQVVLFAYNSVAVIELYK
ncbi:hypothetical protein SLA2020_379170 [Shorea laevis]